MAERGKDSGSSALDYEMITSWLLFPDRLLLLILH